MIRSGWETKNRKKKHFTFDSDYYLFTLWLLILIMSDSFIAQRIRTVDQRALLTFFANWIATYDFYSILDRKCDCSHYFWRDWNALALLISHLYPFDRQIFHERFQSSDYNKRQITMWTIRKTVCIRTTMKSSRTHSMRSNLAFYP